MRGRIVRLGIVLGIIVAIAPVSPAAAGGGGCHEVGMSSYATTDVVMHQACFTPTIARVPLGSTVSWFNKDALMHTVTGANLTFGSYDQLDLDAVTRVRFAKAGVFPYYCLLHPGMVGAIVVGDDDQLLGSLGKTSEAGLLQDAGRIADDPVKVAAPRADAGGSSWPALATGIGLGSVGVGFGVGRRMRRGAGRREGASEPAAS